MISTYPRGDVANIILVTNNKEQGERWITMLPASWGAFKSTPVLLFITEMLSEIRWEC